MCLFTNEYVIDNFISNDKVSLSLNLKWLALLVLNDCSTVESALGFTADEKQYFKI